MSSAQQPPTPELSADNHTWLEHGFLTTGEAGRMLRVSSETIRSWCHAGLLRSVKEPASGKFLVCEADVQMVAKRCDGRTPNGVVLRGLRASGVIGG